MVVFMPTFLAVAQVYGIDPIHLGIVVLIGISMGALTPPVGITLYLTMTIAGVGLARFLQAVWPFYLAVIVTIVLVAAFPRIALWLPYALM
jgi:TRAP-type C4-dicarboxylate transport system permease large subunit